MRISELAKRTGVSAHRLRRYEALGLILAERTASGYREFAEYTTREVVFISMGRDLGFSLKTLADSLPRYRAGTLTIDEMILTMRRRIEEVDQVIAEQRALRQRLVSHIGWFQRRQREHARAVKTKAASRFPAARKVLR
ncbi:MerR family DNA-binding transcriptional regulator [Piscinibacter sp.]|uniref:MerR family DNA-binding transcriptional regulator n=1 Tax=Piscinibacter sp. TaxID=1903157 RepID=UPI002BCFCE0E|nr:MerR family DNA-binding transcriptional regulator [Albitalea sp.]HUG23283.1 MerR family DNA-binding transcriptional regulator [Albitalea sp.]